MHWNGTILNLRGEVTDRHCLCFRVFVISAESQLSSFSLVSQRSSKISSSIHLSGCIPFFTSSSFISLTGGVLSWGIAHGELLSTKATVQSFKESVVCKSKTVNAIYSLSPLERSLCFLATKRAVTSYAYREKHFSVPKSLLAPFFWNKCSII